jgi:hypothetical protein
MSSIYTCDSRVVTLYFMWDIFVMPEPILNLKLAKAAPLYHT